MHKGGVSAKRFLACELQFAVGKIWAMLVLLMEALSNNRDFIAFYRDINTICIQATYIYIGYRLIRRIVQQYTINTININVIKYVLTSSPHEGKEAFMALTCSVLRVVQGFCNKKRLSHYTNNVRVEFVGNPRRKKNGLHGNQRFAP